MAKPIRYKLKASVYRSKKDGLYYAELRSIYNKKQVWQTGDQYARRRAAEHAIKMLESPVIHPEIEWLGDK